MHSDYVYGTMVRNFLGGVCGDMVSVLLAYIICKIFPVCFIEIDEGSYFM